MKQNILLTSLLVLATTSFALPQEEPSLPTTGQCYVDSGGDTWIIYSNDAGQDVVADWDAQTSGTAISNSKAGGNKGGTPINYRGLEKQPPCDANKCYNCIKPISGGSNRPCTVYTKCKRGVSSTSCK